MLLPWSNWRHFRKLRLPPHKRTVPLCRTIDGNEISLGKLWSGLVPRSPVNTSTEPDLVLYPPAEIMQEILPKTKSNSNQKFWYYVQCQIFGKREKTYFGIVSQIQSH